MIGFIEAEKEDPFFFYWASPIPHVALQAPQALGGLLCGEVWRRKNPTSGRWAIFHSGYPHAAYAAMISYLDERVGELVTTLKEQGVYENTLIMFSSDNGPTYNGGTDSPWFGSGGPFKSERGWGKGFLHEGGIRVPLIASWPGHIKAGSDSDHISAFWDLLPTLCDVAGVEAPGGSTGSATCPN